MAKKPDKYYTKPNGKPHRSADGTPMRADFFENERTWSVTYGSDVTATADSASLVTDGGEAFDMHTAKAVAASVESPT